MVVTSLLSAQSVRNLPRCYVEDGDFCKNSRIAICRFRIGVSEAAKIGRNHFNQIMSSCLIGKEYLLSGRSCAYIGCSIVGCWHCRSPYAHECPGRPTCVSLPCVIGWGAASDFLATHGSCTARRFCATPFRDERPCSNSSRSCAFVSDSTGSIQ